MSENSDYADSRRSDEVGRTSERESATAILAPPATASGEGKVAQVLNERELVINLGEHDGVMRGMRFAVLAPTPTPIRDPDSGEPLGQLDREKVRVEVVEVHERMAVAETYESRSVGGGWLLGPSVAEAMGPVREVFETFRYSKDATPAPIAPDESYVKIGDRVKRIDRH